jgi:hypothetical protein
MNLSNHLKTHEATLQFFDFYNHHQVPAMLDLFMENSDIVFIPLGDFGRGKVSELGQAIWSQLIESFPDIECRLLKSKTDDEGNTICEVMITGTQVRDFAGISSKGLRFESEHIFVFRLGKNGLIDRMTVTWDHNHFCRQLGYNQE